MKRITVALIIALVLLLAPSVASAATGIEVVSRTGDGVWTDDTWQVQMFPGEEKATTLSLYNSASSSLDAAVTVSPSSLDNGNLTFELAKSSFTMPGKSYADVTLSVRASGSATPGTYTTELEIKSEVTSPAGGGGGGGGPGDTTPPRISDILASAITETSADIAWETNEKSDSQVEYWSSPSEFSTLDTERVIYHHAHLSGLTPGTTYHYKTMSRDAAGNLAVSDMYTFTTLGKPPVPPPAPPAPVTPAPPAPPTPPEVTPPVTPVVPTPVVNWPLIGGIIAGVVIVGLGVFFWMRRRAA
jgi:hypothetical protein